MMRGFTVVLVAMCVVACDNKQDYKSTDDRGITLVNRVNINTPEVSACKKERCDGEVPVSNGE